MNDSSVGSSKGESRILVLEPDESLVSSILSALHEAAPAAVVEVARNLEEAHRIVLSDRPDLFVLDMDAADDLGQDFLIDLRTSHPEARAIILTAVHLAWQREQAAGIGAIHFRKTISAFGLRRSGARASATRRGGRKIPRHVK